MEYEHYEYEEDTTQDAPWVEVPAETSPLAIDRSTLFPLTPNPVIQTGTAPSANVSETVVLSSLLQSIQQTQTQQMYMLRNLDARLARLEEPPRPVKPVPTPKTTQATNSFEAATWWAIWGLLMLILGGALAFVIALILFNARLA
jgi:hypothetical protein